MGDNDLEERVLTDVLDYWFNVPEEIVEKRLQIRERVETIRHMQIFIYSLDHDPPHFHVKSKDGKVDARFLLENGNYWDGKIGTKDQKRIEAFFADLKTQIMMKRIWDKRIN
jgi:hypothetical protein